MSRIDRISVQEALEIRQLFANGHTVTAIARMTKRCTRTVGYVVGTRKPTPEFLKARIEKASPEPAEEPVGYWPDGWMIKPIPPERLRAGRA